MSCAWLLWKGNGHLTAYINRYFALQYIVSSHGRTGLLVRWKWGGFIECQQTCEAAVNETHVHMLTLSWLEATRVWEKKKRGHEQALKFYIYIIMVLKKDAMLYWLNHGTVKQLLRLSFVLTSYCIKILHIVICDRWMTIKSSHVTHKSFIYFIID